jgi:hypothetical protein
VSSKDELPERLKQPHPPEETGSHNRIHALATRLKECF